MYVLICKIGRQRYESHGVAVRMGWNRASEVSGHMSCSFTKLCCWCRPPSPNTWKPRAPNATTSVHSKYAMGVLGGAEDDHPCLPRPVLKVVRPLSNGDDTRSPLKFFLSHDSGESVWQTINQLDKSE